MNTSIKTLMTAVQIKEVLRLHSLWLLRERTGQRANLTGANLQGADLAWADLRGANLAWADMSAIDLRGANLSGANLTDANLQEAFLYKVNLEGADLTDANLQEAFLYKVNLEGADLEGADLEGANLESARMSRANLSGAKLPDFQICPKEGQFIGWKKVQGNVILKLLILKASKRTSSLIGRKCRASKVKVLEAFGGKPGQKEFKSIHDSSFTYRIGKHTKVANFDGDIREECTSGIHFFLTRKEAEEYSL